MINQCIANLDLGLEMGLVDDVDIALRELFIET